MAAESDLQAAKAVRNLAAGHHATLATGRFFTCSKFQFRPLPTRFPKWTRCQVPTVSIFRRTV